jgi:hypothetical protein
MAKPKLALIPSTVGGSVYSVLPSNGDGDFNFTRASAATRINAQGLIETVAATDNRLNYPLLDGTVQTCPHLLLESQRTNLITYSESFSNAYWTKSGASITSNAAISPDGTLNADKLVEGSGTGAHLISRSLFGSGVNLAKYTLSIFAKKGERDLLVIQDGTTVNNAFFDLTNGVVAGITGAGTAKIESLGNDFYRCSFTFTQSGVDLRPQFALADITLSGSPPSYTGDGTSGVYIFGAQLEEGSYPTSYIVSNSGSATTRIAEVCDGSGNASTFNDSEGVLMVQAGALADDLTNRQISLSDGTTSNRIVFRYFTSLSNQVSLTVIDGGVIQAEINYQTEDIKDTSKYAIKYKVNDFSLWVNGFEVGVDTSGSVPTGLSALSFSNAGGTLPFYGKTKQIQYFDSALTDSELETLTSWMSFSDMAIDLNYTIQ